jgi:Secretion system C-terminal sorting domain/Ricin-type beta-trefoil lectin domain-like
LGKTVYTNVKAGTYEVKIKNNCGEASVFVTLPPATAYYYSSKCYRIINVNSGKALVVQGAGLTAFTAITQSTYTGGSSQQWQLTDVGSAFAKFTAHHSNMALTSNVTTEGANLYQNTYTAGGQSDWDVECMGGGYYRIVHRLSGKYLSIEGNSLADNANAEIRADNQSNSSVYWQIEEVACSFSGLVAANSTGTTAVANPLGTNNLGEKPVINKLPSDMGTKLPVSQVQNVQIFPNPAQNYIDLELKELPENDITVTLLNVLGSRSLETQAKATQSLRLDTQSVPSGLYILQISEKGKPIIRKEVVIHK